MHKNFLKNCLKSEVDKLNVDNLKTVPIDLKLTFCQSESTKIHEHKTSKAYRDIDSYISRKRSSS